jgi:hypothetical protein
VRRARRVGERILGGGVDDAVLVDAVIGLAVHGDVTVEVLRVQLLLQRDGLLTTKRRSTGVIDPRPLHDLRSWSYLS